LTSSSAVPLELELVNMTATLKSTDGINEVHTVDQEEERSESRILCAPPWPSTC
jgi:hypothetical protein